VRLASVHLPLPASEGGLEALGDTDLLEAWASVVP
jgi:hypothetical protein